jgi:glycosyltransferase involved in cell wall biosynthesis
MQEELVSVIMPTYNTGRFLSESIDSILNQTHKNLELLITDDGSDDELTLQILKQYAEKDSRVNVLYLQGNNGPGIARNKSIERAQGRYIAFCDSDDRWFPEKLEKQIRHMAKHDCAICSSSYLVCNEKNELRGINISPSHITYSMLKRDNKIGCLTAIYDIQRLGRKYYMPAIRKRQDWALFLNILRDCQICFCLKEPLAYYRQRRNSVSSDKISLIKYNANVYETVLGHSKFVAYLYLFFQFLPSYYLKVRKRRRDSERLRNGTLKIDTIK